MGIRPTIGLVSRDGISPYSFDQELRVHLWTVEDAVRADAIAGYDPADAETAWSAGNVPATYTEYLARRPESASASSGAFGDKA